jgi:hypothetical protein
MAEAFQIFLLLRVQGLSSALEPVEDGDGFVFPR